MERIRQLRQVGIAEGISFIVLLFIAMPLKYSFGYPLAVTIVGSLHGLLFILYMIALARASAAYKWDVKRIAEAFIAALCPFGTFILDRKLRHEEQSQH